MIQSFEFAGGMVTGRDHLKDLKWSNGQDNYHFRTAHGCHLGFVSDGCGSGKSSETGSSIIVRIACTSLAKYLPKFLKRGTSGTLSPVLAESFPYWLDVQNDIVAHLRVLAYAMGEDLSELVPEFFLATLFGYLITPFGTFVVSIGDGCYAINGEFTAIDSGVGNDPDYIAYHVLNRRNLKTTVGDCNFVVRAALPTDDLKSLLVATDGAARLASSAELDLPGKPGKKVGPISQFWTDDDYFMNQFQVGRKLALVNFETSRVSYEEGRINRFGGLLNDDTALIAVRKVQ